MNYAVTYSTVISIHVCVNGSGNSEIDNRIIDYLKTIQSDLINGLTRKGGVIKNSFITMPHSSNSNTIARFAEIVVEKLEFKEEDLQTIRNQILKQLKKYCNDLGLDLQYAHVSFTCFYPGYNTIYR